MGAESPSLFHPHLRPGAPRWGQGRRGIGWARALERASPRCRAGLPRAFRPLMQGHGQGAYCLHTTEAKEPQRVASINDHLARDPSLN